MLDDAWFPSPGNMGILRDRGGITNRNLLSSSRSLTSSESEQGVIFAKKVSWVLEKKEGRDREQRVVRLDLVI